MCRVSNYSKYNPKFYVLDRIVTWDLEAEVVVAAVEVLLDQEEVDSFREAEDVAVDSETTEDNGVKQNIKTSLFCV